MTVDYPDDWDTRRREVYRRDNYKCQKCGSQGGYNGDTELHAHHVVPKSRGGTHRKSNLITVCDDCHEKIHGFTIGDDGPSNTEVAIELERNHVYLGLAILAFVLPLVTLHGIVTETFNHSILNTVGVVVAIGVSGGIWWVSVSKLTPLLDDD